MLSITARNVNNAFNEALWKMKIQGVVADSRNGKVMRFPDPVATTYLKPTERMLFDAKRDANPFFHIMEGIWMLAGRDDAAWISQFSSNIAQYAEDNGQFHGAYGFRWREHWGEDQISWLRGHLSVKPNSRRGVIQMFDPSSDQESEAWSPKDIPCNTAIYFSLREDALHMTVTNRSNDLVWGCYGANAVHMSMLQEFLANALGVNVGEYVQFSNDLHIYEPHFLLLDEAREVFQYTNQMRTSHVPMTSKETWENDLEEFEEWCDRPHAEYKSKYINQVLNPMLAAWSAYKVRYKATAFDYTARIEDLAVRMACEQWLSRRKWE